MGAHSIEMDSAQVFQSWVNYFKAVRYKTIRNGQEVTLQLRFPEFVAAQCMHETGWLTSEVYKQNQNLFGMKHNKRGHSIASHLDHALYMNRANSVKDYMVYQDRMLRLAIKQGRPVTTEEDYHRLLEDLPHLRGHRYATDLHYIEKVVAVKEKFQNL